MLLKTVLLTCCQRFNGERTFSAIYHLLQGKRSIQTVQDAHAYRLERFLGIYPTLSMQAFKERIAHCKHANLIETAALTDKCLLTKEGRAKQKQLAKQYPLTYFHGHAFYKQDAIFWKRLVLLIQVLTNKQMDNRSYIPVIDDPHILNWLKNRYKTMKGNVQNALQKIYDELSKILHLISDEEAYIFVSRLTGYRHFGMSYGQLANHFQRSIEDIQLIHVATIHFMLLHISKHKQSFPFLTWLIDDFEKAKTMTESAQKSYQLLKKGYSVEQIASLRKLTIHTIYDHLVEACLYDEHFPLRSFIDDDTYEEVFQTIQEKKTATLKVIKENVRDEISYFQIRLVLATAKDKQGESNDNIHIH